MTEDHQAGGLVAPLPQPVSTLRVTACGTVAWAVALVVTLVVPTLHTGDRSWWPWTAVTGIVLGVAGMLYLRRGRGNAAADQD